MKESLSSMTDAIHKTVKIWNDVVHSIQYGWEWGYSGMGVLVYVKLKKKKKSQKVMPKQFQLLTVNTYTQE